jgi:hypothetical protein
MANACEKRTYSKSLEVLMRGRDYAYASRCARVANLESRNLHKYDLANRNVLVVFRRRNEGQSFPYLRLQAERLRPEFAALVEQWQLDTRHLSLICKKITHEDYFRIIGMGRPVIPLLLEELRKRPAHWFAALRATANVDPSPEGATPSQAREAWLEWGKSRGYID